MKTGPKPKISDARFIRTMAPLAELLGCDVGTVSKYCKRPDWPFAKRAPWPRSDVPDMIRWRAEQLNRQQIAIPDDGDEESVAGLRKQKLQQEVRKLRAEADTKEAERDRIRLTLLDAEQVRQEWVAIGVRVRNELQNLAAQIIPRALTHGLPHGAAAVLQREIEAMVAAPLRSLSGATELEDAA